MMLVVALMQTYSIADATPYMSCDNGIEADVINAYAYQPSGQAYHNGYLYYTEYLQDRMMRWHESGQDVYWHMRNCGPTHLQVLSSGEMVIACLHHSNMIRIDEEGITSDIYPIEAAHDFMPDSKGGMYFRSRQTNFYLPAYGDPISIDGDNQDMSIVQSTDNKWIPSAQRNMIIYNTTQDSMQHHIVFNWSYETISSVIEHNHTLYITAHNQQFNINPGIVLRLKNISWDIQTHAHCYLHE